MPFTPYHFGPSAFLGLIFRKWIDIPVFVLANVIVDIEVLVVKLFKLGWPWHRYCHTLLIGGAVGVAWAMVAYPLRGWFAEIMKIVRLPHQSSLWKMIISGVLGVWFHVVIDAVYHLDVKLFWPGKARPLWNLLSHAQVEGICIDFYIAVVILYAAIALRSARRKD